MDRIIRVDHAGEYGAQRIYEGQIAGLGKSHPAAPTLQTMRQQEREHLAQFQKLVRERRVRPSLLMPFWHVAGYAIGYGTAAIGKEAAMACTQAVEEVIASHYNAQLRELIEENPKDTELRQIVKKFRDDEQEHHDIAVEQDAEKAPLYSALYQGIKQGTSLAVNIASKL